MVVQLLPFYALVAIPGAVLSALYLATEETPLSERLQPEGRVVLGILAGVLWPLFGLAGLLWLLRATGRGVMQVARLVRPAKPKIPRAEVRR